MQCNSAAGQDADRAGESAMTGCDLRFMAEELCARSHRERTDTREVVRAELADLVFSLENEPLARVIEAVKQHVERIRSTLTTDAENARLTFDAGHETIDKVREHFHEAVDARVEEEIENREPSGISEEEKDEAINEAMHELRDSIEEAVVRAVRNA